VTCSTGYEAKLGALRNLRIQIQKGGTM